ncbi:fasciclin domain-containing protein [Maribacter sp. 2210JD10-5]|uniref:fasciclin domain-containing protein n=1 Tax=Maribacter sp. 2210JD10-5 TaxID=3386272 RepID=UPI0039BC781E
MKIFFKFNWMLLIISILFISSCNKNDDNPSPKEEEKEELLPTIVELAGETEQLSLLVEAIEKANLSVTLNGEGPYTVFAPTNTAIEDLFVALGDGFNSFNDFDNFLEIELLTRILKFHIVSGNIMKDDLTPGAVPTLFTDNSIEIIASDDSFVIGDASEVDATITVTDNMASNGVVHVIDKILIPAEVQEFLDEVSQAESKTIKELVEENDDFSFLKEALEITGLLDTLGEDGPFTVFAPTSEALSAVFTLLGAGLTEINDFDTEFEIGLLRDVLSYHIHAGKLTAQDLSIGELPTLSEDNIIDVSFEDGNYVLNDVTKLDANFKVTDIPANNGVVHTIDRLLLPESVINDIHTDASRALLGFLSE